MKSFFTRPGALKRRNLQRRTKHHASLSVKADMLYSDNLVQRRNIKHHASLSIEADMLYSELGVGEEDGELGHSYLAVDNDRSPSRAAASLARNLENLIAAHRRMDATTTTSLRAKALRIASDVSVCSASSGGGELYSPHTAASMVRAQSIKIDSDGRNRDLRVFLERLKQGWGEQFHDVFDVIGAKSVDDLHGLKDTEIGAVERALQARGARLVDVRRITESVRVLSQAIDKDNIDSEIPSVGAGKVDNDSGKTYGEGLEEEREFKEEEEEEEMKTQFGALPSSSFSSSSLPLTSSSSLNSSPPSKSSPSLHSQMVRPKAVSSFKSVKSPHHANPRSPRSRSPRPDRSAVTTPVTSPYPGPSLRSSRQLRPMTATRRTGSPRPRKYQLRPRQPAIELTSPLTTYSSSSTEDPQRKKKPPTPSSPRSAVAARRVRSGFNGDGGEES